jgi:exonuclease VII small subunit
MPEDWIHLPDSVVAATDYDALAARLASADREATVLVVAMADQFGAPDNWKPLPDAAGMITQISNMVAGLREERALIVARAENAEAALVEAEQEYQDARIVRKQLEARLADTEQQRDDALALLTKISLRKSCEGTQPYICHGLATARSWLAAADARLKEARDEINRLSGYAEDETDGKSGLTTWPLLDRIDAHLAREEKP